MLHVKVQNVLLHTFFPLLGINCAVPYCTCFTHADLVRQIMHHYVYAHIVVSMNTMWYVFCTHNYIYVHTQVTSLVCLQQVNRDLSNASGKHVWWVIMHDYESGSDYPATVFFAVKGWHVSVSFTGLGCLIWKRCPSKSTFPKWNQTITSRVCSCRPVWAFVCKIL